MSFPLAALRRQRDRGRRQRQLILDYLESYQREHGWMPTVREIADDLGVNLSTAHAHLAKLTKEGRIERGPGPRMIRVQAGGSIALRPLDAREALDECIERKGCPSSLHLSTCPEK